MKTLMRCLLCEYTGTDHPILQEIITHVSENAHQVHITELCAQIQPLLKDKLDIDMEVAQLEEHFIRHKCEQKIVLNNILRELVDIVGVAKSNCVVISEETGLHSMEAKNTGVYIDAVKQIMSIYKQLDQCNRGRVT